jgi:hypothetical protein
MGAKPKLVAMEPVHERWQGISREQGVSRGHFKRRQEKKRNERQVDGGASLIAPDALVVRNTVKEF